MEARQLRALVLGEAALVALCGLATGVLVGTVMAHLLVHVLRPLFFLDPHVTFATVTTARVARLVVLPPAAALAAALAATGMLNRMRPTELLREL